MDLQLSSLPAFLDDDDAFFLLLKLTQFIWLAAAEKKQEKSESSRTPFSCQLWPLNREWKRQMLQQIGKEEEE